MIEEVQGPVRKSFSDFFRVMAVIFLLAVLFNIIKQGGVLTEVSYGLFAGLLVCALVTVFSSFKLVTQIREDGIYVRYLPFLPSFVRFGWTEIEEVYIREFDPLMEYNGWGIKTGVSGRSYTIGGNTIGIQLVLQNGTRVLIGTQRGEEVAVVLKKMGR